MSVLTLACHQYQGALTSDLVLVCVSLVVGKISLVQVGVRNQLLSDIRSHDILLS